MDLEPGLRRTATKEEQDHNTMHARMDVRSVAQPGGFLMCVVSLLVPSPPFYLLDSRCS